MLASIHAALTQIVTGKEGNVLGMSSGWYAAEDNSPYERKQYVLWRDAGPHEAQTYKRSENTGSVTPNGGTMLPFTEANVVILTDSACLPERQNAADQMLFS